MKDWQKWHEHYNITESPLSQRLSLVQSAIRQCLPENPVPNYTILDICAGNGRDLLDVLDTYEYKNSLRGCLIELDPRLAEEMQEHAQAANMPRSLKIIQGDASQTYAYSDSIPADLILVCGVFGNISDIDVVKTIQNLPKLCKEGTRVIWTRHRRAPDRTNIIRALFRENGFSEVVFTSTNDSAYGIGVHTFNSSAPSIGENATMFNFIK
jgi:SAM-dependent methyltransferase